MNILYDYEITEDDISFTLTGVTIRERLRDFVYQRLKVCEEEIDSHVKGVICISLFGTLREINPTVPDGICTVGFPDVLDTKIVDSFDEKDWIYIYQQLREIKGALGN